MSTTINPLCVSTDGYLDSPLAVATSGYICIGVTVTEPGGTHKKFQIQTRKGKAQPPKIRTTSKPKSHFNFNKEEFELQHVQNLLREDEEIIILITTVIGYIYNE